MRLEDLPANLLQNIIAFLVADGEVPLMPLLHRCGRILADATCAALYSSMILHDCDTLFLLTGAPKLSFPLKTLMQSAANKLQHLTIVDPPPSSASYTYDIPLEEGESEACTIHFEHQHLDTFDLADFLSRTRFLQTLIWRASRPLPKLTHEISDLTHLTAFECSLSDPAGMDDRNLRWHGEILKTLPSSLKRLCLGALSAKGVRELAQTLPRLLGLEIVELHNTSFVDDALLAALGDLSSLTHLCIRQMSGSKVTDEGIRQLLESSMTLEVLELIEFEGRLSATCWSKLDLDNVAPIKAIRVVYNEMPVGQHSWCLQHLQSIGVLLTLATLQVFSVRRLTHADIYQTARNSHHTLAINDLMLPAKLPAKIAQALVNTDCPLVELGLDLWEISVAQLQSLAECFRCTLQTLQVLVDDDFSRVLLLATNLPGMLKLQQLTVSVTSYDSSGIHIRNVKSTEDMAKAGKEDELIGALPQVKDIKKFVKKSKLNHISWVGRGAYGHWKISKASAASSIYKVEFIEEILNERLELPRSSSFITEEAICGFLAGETLPVDPAEQAVLCEEFGIEQRIVVQDEYDTVSSLADSGIWTSPDKRKGLKKPSLNHKKMPALLFPATNTKLAPNTKMQFGAKPVGRIAGWGKSLPSSSSKKRSASAAGKTSTTSSSAAAGGQSRSGNRGSSSGGKSPHKRATSAPAQRAVVGLTHARKTSTKNTQTLF